MVNFARSLNYFLTLRMLSLSLLGCASWDVFQHGSTSIHLAPTEVLDTWGECIWITLIEWVNKLMKNSVNILNLVWWDPEPVISLRPQRRHHLVLASQSPLWLQEINCLLWLLLLILMLWVLSIPVNRQDLSVFQMWQLESWELGMGTQSTIAIRGHHHQQIHPDCAHLPGKAGKFLPDQGKLSNSSKAVRMHQIISFI